MIKTKYIRLAEICDIYLVDGEIVKDRYGNGLNDTKDKKVCIEQKEIISIVVSNLTDLSYMRKQINIFKKFGMLNCKRIFVSLDLS